ncbi:hypothetical protein EV421DRAFT_1744665 [Armillaria borealis]|uniref:Uncharacterized protein n=1 Tax=Armillaria borealis TaxID=47425 RepID=A0AA39IUI1_9AGAR|nr:hypothetical protein EV421DRAFT_1744665 [Armillaria borealis]
MADLYYLLRAAMVKAPALWDTELFDSLSTHTVAQQVEEAHTLLTSYRSVFAHPYSDLIERFFATASDAVHKLPNCSFNDHWKVWLYSPAMVKEHLKKRKTHRSPSPPTNSGKTLPGKTEAQVKVEKPAPKRSKCDSSSSKVKESECASPPPMKALTGKVKTEPSVPTKEGSVTTEKSQVCGRGRKPAKIPIVEVPTIPRPKLKTPPPTIISEDTHVNIQGRSPTPVTTEYMLDRILTDLPTLMRLTVLCVLVATDFVNIKNPCPLAPIAPAGVTALAVCLLMICRRLGITCYLLLKPLIHSLKCTIATSGLPTVKSVTFLMHYMRHTKFEPLPCVTFFKPFHTWKVLMTPMPWSTLLVNTHETTPKPPLPAFTVLKSEPITKKARRGKEEEEETADSDQVAKALEEDELPSSPARPAKPAGSSIIEDTMSSWPEISRSVRRYGEEVDEEELSPWEREWLSPPSHSYRSLLRPDPYDMVKFSSSSCCQAYPNPLALDMGIPPEQFRSLLVTDHYILLRQAHASHPSLVDMNTLATYLQPEIKSMLDSVHPFLFTHSQAAHEAYFPKDVDPVVIRFLATLTALANNLSPAFQSISWEAWKVEDSTRMFKLLGYSKPSFDPTDIFPGKVTPEHVFRQGLHWEHFQGAASAAWFANLNLRLPPEWLDVLLNIYPVTKFQILDFSILVNWCQPDVVTLINHVHPFLLAHIKHFPDDVDILALRFLMTVTTVANNLGPCFIDPDWSLWKVQDPRRLVIGLQNFMSPFPCDLHFPDSQDPVILSDLSPISTAIPYVGIGCYPMDLDKLPSAIADALRLSPRLSYFQMFFLLSDFLVPSPFSLVA